MYIRPGLAPISDESAHNQGKKAKNLRNSYQVKQCSKKAKEIETQIKNVNRTHFLFCFTNGCFMVWKLSDIFQKNIAVIL